MRHERVVYGAALVASVLFSVWLSSWMESQAQQLVGPFQPTVSGPTRDTNISMVPAVTNAITSQLLVKTSPGALYNAVATNQSATAGTFMIIDAQSIPGDGAVTPKDCRALPASSSAVITYNPGPPTQYISGIVAVTSTGASCFTKTSGAVSGFIAVDAQ